MLTAREVTVTFGGVKPLDGVSFELPAGVCGLVGPNGAGKTTFFNVLSGFVRPSGGTVEVDGLEFRAHEHEHGIEALGLEHARERVQLVQAAHHPVTLADLRRGFAA